MTRVSFVLTLVLIACALSLVTSRHEARRRFVELEREQAKGRQLEVEYGQLELEQSTWATPARIERVARDELHMQLPSAARVEVVAMPGAAP